MLITPDRIIDFTTKQLDKIIAEHTDPRNEGWQGTNMIVFKKYNTFTAGKLTQEQINTRAATYMVGSVSFVWSDLSGGHTVSLYIQPHDGMKINEY